MTINELKDPIWIIHVDLKGKEKIDYLHYLEVATKLSLKEKALNNNYLIDRTNRVLKIIDVIDKGNVNSPWKFEFFNPLKNIELVLEEIKDEEIIGKIKKLVHSNEDD